MCAFGVGEKTWRKMAKTSFVLEFWGGTWGKMERQ
jgi:hypothetical protein